jgi:ribosome biogenesis GTPase
MKKSHSKPGKLDGTERQGMLVAHFGATAEIQDETGHVIYCHIRKNLEPVITGDTILWRMENDNTGTILGCMPRKSLLARPERKNKIKPIAANIDVMVIVTASATLSDYLIDRYLIAAENLKIPAAILLNKIDLLTNENRDVIQKQLDVYKKIGYPVIYSSICTENGLVDLETFLQNKTSVFVGTSGVGKSSIIAKFLPDKSILIGETSAAGLGKHTTTSTRLYQLPHGGHLIDSPGVREFGLWHIEPKELLKGFVEFQNYFGECKFRDCRHLKEPGCALQNAALENKISLSRLESYRKILDEIS